jgi:tRNA-dependent cyclodipeptide synthase
VRPMGNHSSPFGPAGSAFVGVSLDSADFSRDWIRDAITHILGKHPSLLFVLADRLLAYNKSAHESGAVTALDLEQAARRINQRREDITRFISSEVARLGEHDRTRVQIARWDEFSDYRYANLLRNLRIAFATLEEFRLCVKSTADRHLQRRTSSDLRPKETELDLCISYVLDETAMSISVTELGGRPYEYYPEMQIDVLAQLYQGRFSHLGLSVEKLTGKPQGRVFTCLNPARGAK